jgi:hypothetical protein
MDPHLVPLDHELQDYQEGGSQPTNQTQIEQWIDPCEFVPVVADVLLESGYLKTEHKGLMLVPDVLKGKNVVALDKVFLGFGVPEAKLFVIMHKH